MDLLRLARQFERSFATGDRVVRLSHDRKTVFVGDIHGDLDAFERALAAAGDAAVVFLGDLVDRGPLSRDVLERALAAKLERPEAVHILMGNHEAWAAAKFRPADFWQSLSPGEVKTVGAALLRLPFAASHPAGVLGVHGALPDLASLDLVSSVSPGDPAWRAITWGDWGETSGAADPASGRPRFGPGDFRERSARLGARVVVRSHQPDAPTYQFDDRCLTLFTSSSYGESRQIAILPRGRCVQTARDLDLVRI